MTQPFSVLMSVYKNDRPEWVRIAVESISIRQTIQPNEIFIVVDGPIPETLSRELIALQNEIPTIHVEWCKENRGLGNALQHGMERVKNELVARMDSDDIAVPSRFEWQLEMFENNKNLSAASGHISEFIDKPDNIVGYRNVPIGNGAIRSYMKKRDGLNHVAVMFKKSEVLKAGNYQDWYYNEDSWLWLRMCLYGCEFDNLNKVLVNVRVGKDMYARRGGWKYFKSEARLQKIRLDNHIITIPRYCWNICVHFVVKILVPNSVRGFIFRNLLRKNR